MFERTLNLHNLLKEKSFFLFGPRATGKTWLIRNTIADNSRIVNLLETDTLTRFLAEPSQLRALIKASEEKSYIVIDAIQKVPSLLDEVHLAIEEHGTRFLLTGSSARSLRKRGSNLLAGRAWKAELFPLTSNELEANFDLDRYLLIGGLPAVQTSIKPFEDLYSYVDTYLKEEVMTEALVRNLPAFTRFLSTVALCDAKIINYTKIGNDAQVPPSTIREYFSILEDTLLGFTLPAWTKSKKRKSVQTGKFYLFDTGVGNALRQIESIPRNSDLYGDRFEHFIGMELRAFLSYTRKRETLSFWRSVNGQEVDYLIGNKIAIEVKASKKVSKHDRKGLIALQEEGVFQKYYLVSHDPLRLEVDGIIQIPWQEFLAELWGNHLC